MCAFQRLFPSFPLPHVGHFYPAGKVVKPLLWSDDFSTDTTAYYVAVLDGVWSYDAVEEAIKSSLTTKAHKVYVYNVVIDGDWILEASRRGGKTDAMVHGLSFLTVDASNYYFAPVIDDGIEHAWRMYKHVACAYTLLATVGWTPTTEKRTLRVKKVGYDYEGTIVETGELWTVTDTAFTTGKHGFFAWYVEVVYHDDLKIWEDPPPLSFSTLSPKIRRFYLIPIVGSGTLNDPFRPNIPYDPKIAWSALIPTSEGIPIHDNALVVLVAPEEKHELIRAIDGVREIKKEEDADEIGRRLDPKLKVGWIKRIRLGFGRR